MSQTVLTNLLNFGVHPPLNTPLIMGGKHLNLIYALPLGDLQMKIGLGSFFNLPL